MRNPELPEGEGEIVDNLHNRPNSIYLFGNFSVRDRHNREINYLFSPKLKQAFILISNIVFPKESPRKN